MHFFNDIRAKVRHHITAKAPHHQQDTGDLEAAAGRSCAGSAEHQEYEHSLREAGPLIDIIDGVACRGHNGTDMKESIPKGPADRLKAALSHQVEGDHYGRDRNDA